MKPSRLLFVVFTGILLLTVMSRCHSQSPYAGDGLLTDRGPFVATDRYVLDLGPIILDKQGTFAYRLNNLPEVSFVIGIEIDVLPKNRERIESHSVNPNLFIELLGPQGEPLIRNQSSLITWTWSTVAQGSTAQGSTAFIYRRDEPSTFFVPLANKEYGLRITVVRPDDSGAQYTARLLAKSGGWK